MACVDTQSVFVSELHKKLSFSYIDTSIYEKNYFQSLNADKNGFK